MKQLLQIFLVLAVLALGGAMAQTTQPATLPALPTLVLPVGVELSDEELAGVEGKWLPVGAAVVGAVSGATQRVAENVTSGRSWNDGVARAAGYGAITGAIAGGTVVKAVIRHGGRMAETVVDWVSVGRQVVAGAVGGFLSGR